MIMTQITLSPVTDPGPWAAALARAGGAALQQHWAYGEIARATGRDAARVALWQGGALVGVAQVIGIGGLRVLNRGPVWMPGVAGDVRLRALRGLGRGLRPLLAMPDGPLGGPGLVPLITPRHHAIWDLAAPLEDLRAGLSGKWRNRLAGAERAGLHPAEACDPGPILRAEAAQQRQRGYRNLPPGFVEGWAQRVPGGLLALQIAGADGSPVAGMVFLCHGTQASWHAGWSVPAPCRPAGAHQILLWQAALRLRARGVRSLDLGAIEDGDGAGRMRFKLGTGARPHAFGAFCLVLPGPVSRRCDGGARER